MDTITEKLRKLLSLARQGVGGERANAQDRLESMMLKHGITLTDLEGEERAMHWFRPANGDYGKRLFYQVMFAVTGEKSTWKSRQRRGQVGAKVTAAEKIEFELKYSAYVPALRKEMDVQYKAFVQVNKIFHSDSPGDEPSEIDLEEIRRVMLAMRGMEPVPVLRALPQHNAPDAAHVVTPPTHG